jgi:dTDP-4-dehydrorhamnose reductase
LENLKILVTGSGGQLGSAIKKLASNQNQHEFTFVDVAEMDMSSENSIRNYFVNKRFNIIVNCAAYTAVDQAEEDVRVAYLINAEAVAQLAKICHEHNTRLIHISTDYVFDGMGNTPLNENSSTNPLSVYGKSKLEGEQQIAAHLSDAYIIRTSWLYSAVGKNFVKTISQLARQRATLNVIYDQIGTPTYASDLASAIVTIIANIAKHHNDRPGVYHYSNEGAISWYDFACAIVDFYKLSCKITPVKTEEYKTRATRPAFSLLDKHKIKNTLGIEIPYWHTSLRRCLAELQTEG